MKLCGCIAGKTIDECKEILEGNNPDMIEHRLDALNDIEGLEEFYREITVPIIATCRPNPSLPEGERKVLLKKAIDFGATIIDLEEDSDMEEIVNYAKQKMVQIIISFHDYEQTPSMVELSALYQGMAERADIVKIVPTAGSIEEAHQILELLMHKEGNTPLVAFSMGDKGKFTRPLSLFYGAPFTYVSLGHTTAPGQLSIDSMREILKVLG